MNKLAPAAARLKALREATIPKLSVRAAARALGIPTSSYAFYEDSKGFKKSFLPIEFAREVATVFGGYGVSEEEVLALAGVGAAVAPTDQSEDVADSLNAVMLREIDVGYSMGGGTTVDDYPVIQLVPFSRAWLTTLTSSHASKLVVARGDGDSMMPTLLDEDRVIIDLSERSMRRADRIWAVSYAGFGMIKRLRALPDGTLQINSDNPSVSPIIASDGEAHIIGRVVGVIRRL